MKFISGTNRNQILLLPDSVEDYVDENNAVRVIEAYVNSLNLSELGFEKTEPRNTGRPPYDPKDLLKLYVYGYLNKIRSSRRLEAETRRNLEVIWLLCQLTPDHKTISEFRKINPKALKNVFRGFVKLCMRMGLYGRELVGQDSTKFKAVNSKDRNYTAKKLQDKLARIDKKIEEYMRELDEQDSTENSAASEKSAKEISEIVKGLNERKEVYESYAKKLKETGETQISLTDPDSRKMKCNGKMDIAYNVQAVVDAKNKLIAEFEVTNCAADDNQITPMTERAKEIMEVDTITALVDVGYDSVQDIVSAMENGVDVHVNGTDFDICVPSEESETQEITGHKNGRPVYFAGRNIALCPMGNVMYPKFYKNLEGKGVFHNSSACKNCTCKCTKQKRGRSYAVRMAKEKFSKDYNEEGLYVKQVRIRPNKELAKQRKAIAEHPFGTIKRGMDAGYCLLKGIEKVRGELSLTFLTYNLKRVINIMGVPKLIQAIQGL